MGVESILRDGSSVARAETGIIKRDKRDNKIIFIKNTSFMFDLLRKTLHESLSNSKREYRYVQLGKIDCIASPSS